MFLTEHTEHTEHTKFAESNHWFYFFRKAKKIKPTFSSFFSVISVRDLRCFSAFTLIEVLITMVVITILVGITIPISKYVTLRARLANQRVYIEKIKSALEDYRAAYGEYPITHITNTAGDVLNSDDVLRHYDLANYLTECHNPTGGPDLSPFTNVDLTASTVETMEIKREDGSTNPRKIDYCLTYPLMIKQRLKGARPFMEFKDITVLYYVHDPNFELTTAGGDKVEVKRTRRAGGIVDTKTIYGIMGNPISRPAAIDPASQKQWKYISTNGATYILTNHNETGF